MTNAFETPRVAYGFEPTAFIPAAVPQSSGAIRRNLDDLILHLPRTSEAVATVCAKKLVQAGLVTPHLVALFLNRQDRSSLVILSEDVSISSDTLHRFARSGSPLMARAIAARHDLTEDAISLLLARKDPVIDHILAEQSGVDLSDAALDLLVRRAVDHPALAKSILSRSDLTPVMRAALFVHASPRQRIEILAVANALGTSKPHLLVGSRIDDIRLAIETGNAPGLTECLATLHGVPYDVLYRLLGETSGALLALALIAAETPVQLIKKACLSSSFRRIGMPGGVDDVLETTHTGAARWILAAHAQMVAPVKQPVASNARDLQEVERLIA